jgi:chromosome segregation ATPase
MAGRARHTSYLHPDALDPELENVPLEQEPTVYHLGNDKRAVKGVHEIVVKNTDETKCGLQKMGNNNILAELRDLRRQVQNQGKVIQHHKQFISHLRKADPSSQTTSIASLRVQIDSLNAQVAALTEENVHLKAQVAALMEENVNLKEENVNLNARVAALTEENVNLNTRMDGFVAQLAALAQAFHNSQQPVHQ